MYVFITGCDLFSSDPLGDFTSPNYPDDYPDNAQCTYIIDVPGATIINVEFNDFDLELYNDYLYYGKGSIPNVESQGAFTGYDLPDPVQIPGQAMWFIFVSDASSHFRGFSLTWRISGECFCPRIINDFFSSFKHINVWILKMVNC